MSGSTIKCSIIWIFIGSFSLFLMLAYLKPDMLRNSLESFIGIVQPSNTKETAKESYIKKNDRYREPSVFEQSQ